MGYTQGNRIAYSTDKTYNIHTENRLDVTIPPFEHLRQLFTICCLCPVQNSEPQRSADACGIPPGLSAEQLTLLSLIRLARVTIDSVTVPTGSTTTTPRKTSSKGKPPRPLTSKKW